MFYAQAAWIRALWHSRVLRRPLFSAQAAQIRIRRLFHRIVHISRGLVFSAQAAGIRDLWCLWASRGEAPGAPWRFAVVFFMRRIRGSASGMHVI